MNGTDLLSVSSMDVRQATIVHELFSGGIPKPLARAVAALSESESAYVWRTKRPFNAEGDCSRALVGYEGSWVKTALQSSPKTLSFLQRRGWVQPAADGGFTATGGFGGLSPSDLNKTALAFEYVYSVGEHQALAMFGLGPTGVGLAWIAKVAGRPTSPADAWDMYLSPEAGLPYVVTNHLRYLIIQTESTPSGTIPTGSCVYPTGDNEENDVRYYAWHFGSAESAHRALTTQRGARRPIREALKELQARYP